jgi:xanthine/uracil permease
MSESRFGWPADAASLMRAGLLLLATVGVGGLALELAMHRHWQTQTQLIPWFALGVLSLAIALLVIRPSRGSILLARILAGLVVATAIFGVYKHVAGNYDAGPLDLRYYLRWETMSEAERWWKAISKSVGPAPPLAPGALAQSAVLVLLATIRHPAAVRAPELAAERVTQPATLGTPG